MSTWLASWMNCAAFCASSLNSTPWALARMPTGWPCSRAQPVTSDGAVERLELVEGRPLSAEPRRTSRAITSRGSKGTLRSVGDQVEQVVGVGVRLGVRRRRPGRALRQFSRATIRRPIRIASRSSSAR